MDTSIGLLVRNNIHQLFVDIGCSLEDVLGVKDDRNGWQDRVREVHVVKVAW